MARDPRDRLQSSMALIICFDCKPWREKMWCVADLDEDYIAKMEDVLEDQGSRGLELFDPHALVFFKNSVQKACSKVVRFQLKPCYTNLYPS
jgi:hypothetical protein